MQNWPLENLMRIHRLHILHPLTRLYMTDITLLCYVQGVNCRMMTLRIFFGTAVTYAPSGGIATVYPQNISCRQISAPCVKMKFLDAPCVLWKNYVLCVLLKAQKTMPSVVFVTHSIIMNAFPRIYT